MDPRRMKHINSVLYYSPNSIVNSILDPHPSPSNPFKPGSDPLPRYTDLLITRPWSSFFGWTGFIPLDPCYQSTPRSILSVLVHPPPIETLSHEATGANEYRLARDNQWRSLENNIYKAVCALKDAYHLPCVLPFLPHVLGYDSTFTSKARLHRSIDESREWFLVWIGALSYCLFASELYPDLLYRRQRYPAWRRVLEDAGLSSAWVDQLVYSPVADYHSVRRLGCIIHLLTPEPGQPDVDWFLRCDVPVWYPWGEAEEREAERRRGIRDYCPSIGPFQRFPGHGLLPSARHGDASEGLNPVVEEAHVKLGVGREPEWAQFLREREEKRPLIQAKESAKQRQIRENRTRDPPTSSAPVFEWSLEGKGTAVLWTRVPVPAKWRSDTLALYGKAQKHYDPFFNEWDCCDEFGGVTEEEEDWMDSFTSDYPLASTSSVHTSPLPVAGLSLRDVPLSELEPPPDIFQADEPSGQEIEETFRLFYGYITPVLGAPITENDDSRRRDIFFRLLGQRYDCPGVERLAFFASKPYPPVQYLIDCTLDRSTQFNGVCDRLDDCLSPVRFRPRFSMLRLVLFDAAPGQHSLPNGSNDPDSAGTYYILEDPAPHVPWKLSFTSASAALTACRLPDDFTPFDVAVWLVQRGIPFRIFYPSQPVARPISRPIPTFEIPVRPFHHKFTKEDYHSYVNLRTLILGQPHMQAAMKRGGIVWRLAIGTLGISGVFRPPSQWCQTRRLSLGDTEYLDDTLTMNELDLICGAYECIADDGKQRSLKSWWPLVWYYEKAECGENYGRWCGRREAWYEQRLADIEKDDFVAKPMTYTEWKSNQHGPRLVRSFHASVERSSLDLIAKHAPPWLSG